MKAPGNLSGNPEVPQGPYEDFVKRLQTREALARLNCLSQVMSNGFEMPIYAAARWVSVEDLPAFADELEIHLRAIANLLEEHLQKNRPLLERRVYGEREYGLKHLERDFDWFRKRLSMILRIASGEIDLDIGDDLLPRVPDKV